MGTVLSVRHNVNKVTSIKDFSNIEGTVNGNCKDVYFVRLLGADSDYLNDIKSMDQLLGNGSVQGKGYYKRIQKLPNLSVREDTIYYSEQFEKWKSNERKCISLKITAGKSEEFGKTIAQVFEKIEQLYMEYKPQSTETMIKNLMVKFFFWVDYVLEGAPAGVESMSSKIVAENVSKAQEYLFWYMISLLGNDVLLLQYEKDVAIEERWLELSSKHQIGNFSAMELPEYSKPSLAVNHNADERVVQNKIQNNGSSNAGTASSGMVQVVIPKRERRTPVTVSVSNGERRAPVTVSVSSGERKEKSYEELARMASSVVMIAVLDDDGEVHGTGSGIMIGKNGYILTNHHVICRGLHYSVKIEEDDQVYETDELIKYNQVLDLAVIRIHRQLNPLPIYDGKQKLVRGQKVVAIGSPLGLINSVSDGIISGFRVIDQVDMIQFTAPVSHGSSGGALLNTYGEVIGMSTAIFNDGQNINLAMGYECIKTFVQGFI